MFACVFKGRKNPHGVSSSLSDCKGTKKLSMKNIFISFSFQKNKCAEAKRPCFVNKRGVNVRFCQLRVAKRVCKPCSSTRFLSAEKSPILYICIEGLGLVTQFFHFSLFTFHLKFVPLQLKIKGKSK